MSAVQYNGHIILLWRYCRVVLDRQLQYHTHIQYLLMSKVVVQHGECGGGLLAVIQTLSAGGWWWLRCRAGLPCSDEASSRPRAMMYRWLCSWLAGGAWWNWWGCDWCCRAAAGSPDERGCARSMRLRGRAVGHHVFCLVVSFLDVLFTDTPFQMNESCWAEWPLFIPVACCQACSVIGWLAELVGMARWM